MPILLSISYQICSQHFSTPPPPWVPEYTRINTHTPKAEGLALGTPDFILSHANCVTLGQMFNLC